MNNKRQTGSRYEQMAAEYLKQQGYRILEMNFRCRDGEVDIVAEEASCLVFVEVKYRSSEKYGLPQEAVTRRKQRSISRVAQFYRVRYRVREDVSSRFDVVAILNGEIRLYQNAFLYQEF